MRTTVILPDDLMRLAKQKAAEQNRTLTSLIEEGVRTMVAGRAEPAKRRRVVLPVSKAKGWLHPGLTLRDIDEMQDADYIERLKQLK